jgi:hypothetical protein
MVRPMSGLQALGAKMGAQLSSATATLKGNSMPG